MSLLEFYYCSCDGPHRCHSYPIFVLFVAILSVSHVQLYVTVSKPMLVKLYPYKASVL